eukprot:TRINITY_DN25928_c0_g1_i1.p1 TRINITY_DN25928_c0_g1~~TRINITY_DN25928_c0_g1_i1.p1  ORF type:complete len:240 (-),score=26.19 TRINITY_DN25928_c0_g1_i1:56-742(-)
MKVTHFVLLSAIFVQKPLLAFQEAKLRAEELLRIQATSGGMTYTIVRPTAFMKSLVSQVARVSAGAHFVIFGSGDTVRCAPISRQDLASFLADCLRDKTKRNATLPISGPGPSLSKREQGLLIFKALRKAPKFLHIPIIVLDLVEKIAELCAFLCPTRCYEAPEYARIVRYYATESMMVLDPETSLYSEELTPSYGSTTLADFLRHATGSGSAVMDGERMGDAGLWRE